MLLGIRYLTGYCVARDLTRQQPEWPPHPARVFMAMAAAHFECGAEVAERAALLWLENQPPPRMFASPAFPRSPVETYVPVNDQHGGIVKRPRQSRSFAVVRPHNDSVYLEWDKEPDDQVREAIARLCTKVTRIGHSSSLVQMWLPDTGERVEPNWIPEDIASTDRLRVPRAGLLEFLERSFNALALEEYSRLTEELSTAKGKAKAAIKRQIEERFGNESPRPERPVITNSQGYRDSTKQAAVSRPFLGPFDPDFIVLSKFEGPILGLESTLQLTLALRNAFLKACPAPQPEWVSGHTPETTPSKHPHLAFFPLPFVAADYADGHVMGLGVAVPTILVGESRSREQALRETLSPLFFPSDGASERKLKLWKEGRGGKAWEWKLQRELREDPPTSLNTRAWTGPSKQWATVTPLVLHHYPKKGDLDDVVRIVRDAFASALLPVPESIQISIASAHVGAGSLRDMPSFTEDNGVARYSTHVVATFSEEVTGPMLVGRGRFRGYGLFRPFFTKRESA